MGNIMTCKINADTSDGLKIVSDTSGTVDIQANGTTIAEVSSSSLAVTVAGSGATDALKLKTTATNSVPGILFSGDLSDSQLDVARIRGHQDSSTVSGLTFETKTGGSIAEKMRLTGAGNLGVGQTSPATKLDVGGNIRLSAGSPVIELNNGGPQLYLPAANTLGFATGGGIGSATEQARVSSSGFHVATTGTVSSTGSWTGSGDVKFHTTSPSLNLGAFGVVVSHTYRGVFFTNGLWNVYDENNTGVHLNGGQTSWTANSDERIKKNITELNGSTAYNHVKAARAVTFNWKQEDHDTKVGKKIGFIAQDWETNYPELVEETLASPQLVEEIDGIEDDTKIKGMQYTETIPVLMAALKEAIAKIEVLEAKVAALESE
jgi:hypothetical protein